MSQWRCRLASRRTRRPAAPSRTPASRPTGSPASCCARPMPPRVGCRSLEEWALTWLADAARLLVSQAPQVAAQLLRLAVASVPDGSAEHVRLASWLAEALYCLGDRAEAEQVAVQALPQADDPDLRLDLLCTLAKCRMLAGRSADLLATLHEALASPGLPGRHRRPPARPGRAHALQRRRAGHRRPGRGRGAGSGGRGGRLLVRGLGAERDGFRGDGPRTVPGGDPPLRPGARRGARRCGAHRLAAAAAPQQGSRARSASIGTTTRSSSSTRHCRLGDQVGSAFRSSQAHSLLGQLLFETGRWDDALTEALSGSGDLNGPPPPAATSGSRR